MQRFPSPQLKGLLWLIGMIGVAAASLWSSLWASTMRPKAAAAPPPVIGEVPAGALPASPAGDPRPAFADEPAACRYHAGARVAETLGVTETDRRAIPITHVVVLMQENRSFDHYFGKLAEAGQPDAEGLPVGFSNPDRNGGAVAPFHLRTTCIPRDPPHQWEAMHAQWNGGRMDGFVAGGVKDPDHDGPVDDDDVDNRWSMGYYDARDLPFYHWMARTFAIGDRYFSAVMGGTWPNRQILYTGTAHSRRAPTSLLTGERTLFDALDAAGVGWRVYTNGPPRQDCIGWLPGARGVETVDAFVSALAAGTLPPVSFLDAGIEDEHPPSDIQRGEAWVRKLYLRAVASPLWPRLALFFTYDEGGGFADHVPPPAACPPSPDRDEYDRRGTRVPFVVVSPWARPRHVSHAVHDHASMLRFIELLFDLPALSNRDANADALLDLFDFSAPRLATPPAPPAAGRGGCRRRSGAVHGT